MNCFALVAAMTGAARAEGALTIPVVLSPSESGVSFGLHAAGSSGPDLGCDAPCTLELVPGARYELGVRDAHGPSSLRTISFWRPATVEVSPPDWTLRTAGAAVFGTGGAVFVVSGVLLLYGLGKDLYAVWCETCDRASPGLLEAALIGIGLSLPVMAVGGVLVIAGFRPGITEHAFGPAPAGVAEHPRVASGALPARAAGPPLIGVTFRF
jgi:hypothetical protein